MLVPVVWFYFGQEMKAGLYGNGLRVLWCSAFSLRFTVSTNCLFGFPSFEQYWIDNTEFYNSISVGNVKRALATYSSAEEWGRYIEIGAIVAWVSAPARVSICGGGCFYVAER